VFTEKPVRCVVSITILRLLMFVASFLLVTKVATAQTVTVDINRVSASGVGEKIGTVMVGEAKRGLSLKVAVTGLSKGQHGFHVHETGDCGPAMKDGKMTAGDAAGEHFDPDSKKSHKGPAAAGHKGDLPALRATAKGIDQVVAAPRLTLTEIRGRALVIHEGGDNYKDKPENGGGKGRIACGVVPKQ
jgi:superoxide dismutase, Cu-Zn family